MSNGITSDLIRDLDLSPRLRNGLLRCGYGPGASIRSVVVTDELRLHCSQIATDSELIPLIARFTEISSRMGGKRPGAGRKANRGVRKLTLSLRVTPDVKEFLDAQEPSASEAAETLIRSTRQFKAWQSARPQQ